MNKEDPYQISMAIKNFKANKVPDKVGLLVKAQQLYDYLTISERKYINIINNYSKVGQSNLILSTVIF